MRRIRIEYEYDGSEYNGSQHQENGITVQDEIEAAILRLTKQPATLVASGRTDAGVSAMNQVGHFDTEFMMPADRFSYALNQFLPGAIRLKKSEEVSFDFHARFSAKQKTYVYKMYKSEFLSPIRRDTHMQIPMHLDEDIFESEMRHLVGEHDFCGFMASGSEIKNTVRRVFSVELKRQGDELHFYITANGFLYNMVRIIVGTLIEISTGKRQDMKEILRSKDRRMAGATAKASALSLLRVDY